MKETFLIYEEDKKRLKVKTFRQSSIAKLYTLRIKRAN